MKGQFNPVFKFNMELELIEVDCDGVRSGISRHFSTPLNLIERTRDSYQDQKHLRKCDGTYRHKPYHMLKIPSISKWKSKEPDRYVTLKGGSDVLSSPEI